MSIGDSDCVGWYLNAICLVNIVIELYSSFSGYIPILCLCSYILQLYLVFGGCMKIGGILNVGDLVIVFFIL